MDMNNFGGGRSSIFNVATQMGQPAVNMPFMDLESAKKVAQALALATGGGYQVIEIKRVYETVTVARG